MKTPEELAEEYTKDWWGNLPEAEGMRKSARENFLAGYQAAKPQWISVKDRLPEVNTDVLVKVSKGWVESDDNGNNPKPLTYDFYSVMSLYYENNQHVWDTRPVTDACPLKWEDVTHWMPLPEAPKEEK